MAVNPWAVGTDAFLSGLAEREARSRQNLLDTQVLEQQRQNNAYRTQEMDLRAKQEERLTNRDLYEAGMAGTAQATAQMEAEAASQQAKELAAARLQALNAWQTAPSPEAKAAIAQRAVVELGVPAGVFNIGQAQTNTPSLQDQAASAFASGDTEAFQRALSGLSQVAAATRAPERPAADAFQDNPQLPSGTKQWLDSIVQRGVPFAQAVQEVRRGWAQQQAVHPRAELGEASKYIMSMYPESGIMGQRNTPLGAPPQPPGILPAAAQDPTSTQAPPAATMQPADQAAIAALQAAGAPITPANIAAAKAQLAGQ